jgi:hypothetical protein
MGRAGALNFLEMADRDDTQNNFKISDRVN